MFLDLKDKEDRNGMDLKNKKRNHLNNRKETNDKDTNVEVICIFQDE